MEKSQVLGMAVGAGILGSLATYLLLNSNNNENETTESSENLETIGTTNTIIDNNNVFEEIKEDTKSFLSSFWEQTYKEENTKITDTNVTSTDPVATAE